jgi:DNA-binding LacI/PurR family transcriptional regulator
LRWFDTHERYGNFPQLSSVCQNAHLLGRKALKHLLEIISHESAPKQIWLESSYEPMDSTAPPLDES